MNYLRQLLRTQLLTQRGDRSTGTWPRHWERESATL